MWRSTRTRWPSNSLSGTARTPAATSASTTQRGSGSSSSWPTYIATCRPGVDRVIETAPNDARYFAGLMLWRAGELEDEIREGYWSVRPASAAAVFLKN